MKTASFDKVDYIEIETSTNAHLRPQIRLS